MGRRIVRSVLSGLATCAVVGLVTAGALPAVAAVGNTGGGGGTYVGETLVATAWESSVAPFTWNDGVDRHAEDTDLYNYRIGIDSGAIVDYQSTDNLEGLTEAQQDQWYVDAGLAPYEFDWFAFYCPSFRVGSVESLVLDGDTGINLLNVPYRTVASQTGYPAFSGGEGNSWYDSVYNGSTFAPEVTNFDVRLRTATLTRMLDSSNVDNGINSVLSTSYLNFTCPDGYGPEIGRILSSSTPQDYATGRNISVGSTLYIEPYLPIQSLPDVLELPAVGAYIGVTGQVSVNANAALWGVTYVNAGARALPDTGVDLAALWATTTGAVTLALAGLALVVLRRKSAR